LNSERIKFQLIVYVRCTKHSESIDKYLNECHCLATMNKFDNSVVNLPNEFYFIIFEYLSRIDIFYSFLNLNRRLNSLS